jgi:mono/diheme cytochrome c family protein
VTGKPLFPIVEKPYPASDVPGEKTSPTQPTPLAPEPFEPQHIDETQLTNRTPEAHEWAVKTFRTYRNGGPFYPFTVGQKTIIFPGYDGGAEWGGSAADPQTGVLYLNSNQVAWTGELAENHGKPGSGAWIYQNECAICHGDTRAGSPNFPSLIDINKRISEQQIVDTIHGGKGRMPSFPGIRNGELDRLVHYLETGEDLAPGTQLTQVANPATQQPMAVVGKQLYERNCALCHGEDRQGVARAFPRLLGIGDDLSAHQLVSTIRNGKGRMPAFPDDKLSSENLDALLLYLGTGSSTSTSANEANAGAASVENEGREMVSKAENDAEPPRYRFTGYDKFYDPEGYPANAPPWGTLNAIDLNTGKYLWKIPFGFYPELALKGMGNTGSESYGGPIVTAGGLVIIASTVYDKMMHAYDSRTGELLWQYQLPYAGVATPATYMVDGKQYVVIAASGGRDAKSRSEGTYVAFALP